jgi:hypothetical protein
MWAELSLLLTALKGMAGTTRLELATSAVTGQRSNRLNYVPASGEKEFSRSGQKIYLPLTHLMLP